MESFDARLIVFVLGIFLGLGALVWAIKFSGHLLAGGIALAILGILVSMVFGHNDFSRMLIVTGREVVHGIVELLSSMFGWVRDLARGLI